MKVITIEICHFFNVIPEVSSDSQGLFHLQVRFSSRGRTKGRLCQCWVPQKWMRKKGRKAERDDDKNEEEKEN